MGRPQTIQIYLPSGDPAGLRVANLTTRTVRVFDVPRPLLAEFLKLPESGQVGVYYLFGTNDDDTPQCYIGQSGNVGNRLQQHTATKDFWTKAMVAVSLTNEWTATHAAYLEWLSIGLAKVAGRYVLINGNQATNPHTPKPLEADCQEFIETIAVLLATMGTPVLDRIKTGHTTSAGGGATPDQPEELLTLNHNNCDATGYLTAEGMLVLAGSRGRPGLQPSAPASIGKQRDALRAEGVIQIDDDALVFLKDHLFGSPSTAGCVLVGRGTNGRNAWRNEHGLTINELEQNALSDQPSNEETS
jgi:hypothetical protein